MGILFITLLNVTLPSFQPPTESSTSVLPLASSSSPHVSQTVMTITVLFPQVSSCPPVPHEEQGDALRGQGLGLTHITVMQNLAHHPKDT